MLQPLLVAIIRLIPRVWEERNTQFQYWSEILGFTVCNLKYIKYMICIYEELNN